MEKDILDLKVGVLNWRNANFEGFYRDKLWIQCENETCSKWRLLTNNDATLVDLSKPWYCHMNSDSWFNCCTVPEEGYPEESVFHKCGLKFVYSQLPLGSLVLGKVSGWPSWPSILCPDGFTGQYVTYDEDGFVEQYHVEFLGKPHATSWVEVQYVETYCTGELAENVKKARRWYKSALEEAKVLSRLSSEERLRMCHLSCQELNTDVIARKLSKGLLLQRTHQLCDWKATAAQDTKLKGSTDDEEDCMLIDGIEFKTGKCIEEITNQLKEIDILMAELEGCF
ncbi:zinc finger CW-type PWWP domain protein 2-like [Hemiscyllium ocellatum]|uniref:zinc finger CW-type PWWP domain protein 2-like n=1 Tax=Hemiscyllium ocellatum TaxID=170820 RepID=UPI002966E74F|nr:zinc finger CW-type PWWP domain protein 2-like [Hemiscyllium ocellatum]